MTPNLPEAISLFAIVQLLALRVCDPWMPYWGMFRITRFLMVTLSMAVFGSFGSFGSSYTRNAACESSVVVQPVPSRIAPNSPTKVLPVFGVSDRFTTCVPALKQYVVAPGFA